MENSKLKVLHICTTDSGGAGKCCLTIHTALLAEGVDSKVLTLNRKIKCPEVYQYGSLRRFGTLRGLFNKQIGGLFRGLGVDISDASRARSLSKRTGIVTSLPVSIFDLTTHPLVQQADIIHFHWIGNFVDLPSFMKKVKKPIVWTLHDENIFHGIFHYNPGKYANEPLEKKYYAIKKKAISEADNLGIVFLSKMMYDEFADNSMISGRPSIVINNPVDCEQFKPVEKSEARKLLGIPEDKLVFTFVSGRIANPRKGLRVLSEALQKLNIPNVYILAVGSEKHYKPLPLVHPIGNINNSKEMSTVYSCSDYFVMPSSHEAFGLTPIEATACGIPAIMFPVGCSEDLITPQNGVCANGMTQEDLKSAIKHAMAIKYDHDGIRLDVVKRFSLSAIARKYIGFYHRILNTRLQTQSA